MPSCRAVLPLLVSLLLAAWAAPSWSSAAVVGERPYVAGVDYARVTAGADAQEAASLLERRPELMTWALRSWLAERDLAVPPGARWGAPVAGDTGASLARAGGGWRELFGGREGQLGRGLHWADEQARPRAARYGWRDVEREREVTRPVEERRWRTVWNRYYRCTWTTRTVHVPYWTWWGGWRYFPVRLPYLDCGWKWVARDEPYTVTVYRTTTVTEAVRERYEVSPARRGELSWRLGVYDAGSGRLTLDRAGRWKGWLPSSVTKGRALSAGASGDLEGFQVLRHEARDAVREEAGALVAAGERLQAVAGALGWSGEVSPATAVMECEAPAVSAAFDAWHGYRGCVAGRLREHEAASGDVPALALLDDRLAGRAHARAQLLKDYAWSEEARAEGGVAAVLAASGTCLGDPDAGPRTLGIGEFFAGPLEPPSVARALDCLVARGEGLLEIERRLLSAYADHEGVWEAVEGGRTPWHLAAYRSVRLATGDDTATGEAGETVYLCRAGAAAAQADPATAGELGWARAGEPGCAVDGATGTADAYALLRLDYVAANHPDLGLSAVYHDEDAADPVEEGPVLPAPQGTRRGLYMLKFPPLPQQGGERIGHAWVDAFPELVIEMADGLPGRRLLADLTHYDSNDLGSGRIPCRRSEWDHTHGTFVIEEGICTINGEPVEDGGYQLMTRGLAERPRIPVAALLEQGPALWDALRPVSGPAASDRGVPEYVCEDYLGREGVLDATAESGLACSFQATYPDAAAVAVAGPDFFAVLAEDKSDITVNTRSACQVYHRGEYLVGTVHEDHCLVALPSAESAGNAGADDDEPVALRVYASGNHRRLGLPAGRFVDVADVAEDARRIDGAWLLGANGGHHGATLCRAEVDGVRYPGVELPGTDGPYCLVTTVTVAENAAGEEADEDALASAAVAVPVYEVAVATPGEAVAADLGGRGYECAASGARGDAGDAAPASGYHVVAYSGDGECLHSEPGAAGFVASEAFVLRSPSYAGEPLAVDMELAADLLLWGLDLWQLEPALAGVGHIEDAAVAGAGAPPYYTFATTDGASPVGGRHQRLRRGVAARPGYAGLRLRVPDSVAALDLSGIDTALLASASPEELRAAGLDEPAVVRRLLQGHLRRVLRAGVDRLDAALVARMAGRRLDTPAGRALVAQEMSDPRPGGWVADPELLLGYVTTPLMELNRELGKQREDPRRAHLLAKAVEQLNARRVDFVEGVARALDQASRGAETVVAGATSLAWRLMRLRAGEPPGAPGSVRPYGEVTGLAVAMLGAAMIQAMTGGGTKGGDGGGTGPDDPPDDPPDGPEPDSPREALRNPLLLRVLVPPGDIPVERTEVNLLPANCRFLTYHRKAHFMGPGLDSRAVAIARLGGNLPTWGNAPGVGFTGQEIARIAPSRAAIENSWCIFAGDLNQPARGQATRIDGHYRIATNTLAAIKRTRTIVNGVEQNVRDEIVSLGDGGVSVKFTAMQRPEQWSIKPTAISTYVLRARYRHREPRNPDPELNRQQEHGAMGEGTRAGVFIQQDGWDRFVRSYGHNDSKLYRPEGEQQGTAVSGDTPQYTITWTGNVGGTLKTARTSAHAELWVAGDPVFDAAFVAQNSNLRQELHGTMNRAFEHMGVYSRVLDGADEVIDPFGIQVVDLGYRGVAQTPVVSIEDFARAINETADDRLPWSQEFGVAAWGDRASRLLAPARARMTGPGDHDLITASQISSQAHDGYRGAALAAGVRQGFLSHSFDQGLYDLARQQGYTGDDAILSVSYAPEPRSVTGDAFNKSLGYWHGRPLIGSGAFPEAGPRAAFEASGNALHERFAWRFPVRNRHPVGQCGPERSDYASTQTPPAGGNPMFCTTGEILYRPEREGFGGRIRYGDGASVAGPRMASMAAIAQQIARETRAGQEWDAEELKFLLWRSAARPLGTATQQGVVKPYSPRFGFGFVSLDEVIRNAKKAAAVMIHGDGFLTESSFRNFQSKIRRSANVGRSIGHVWSDKIRHANQAIVRQRPGSDHAGGEVLNLAHDKPAKVKIPLDGMPWQSHGALDIVDFEFVLSGFLLADRDDSPVLEGANNQYELHLDPKNVKDTILQEVPRLISAHFLDRITMSLYAGKGEAVELLPHSGMLGGANFDHGAFPLAPRSGEVLSIRESSYDSNTREYLIGRRDAFRKPYPITNGYKYVTQVAGLYMAQVDKGDALLLTVVVDENKRSGNSLPEMTLRQTICSLLHEIIAPGQGLERACGKEGGLRYELYFSIPRVTIEAWPDPLR